MPTDTRQTLMQQEYTQDARTKLVRTASFVSLTGNALLCVLKLTAGLLTGSLAVLGDGLDSAADVGVAVMAVFVSFVISKPSDSRYPWGRQRAETIASFSLAFIILFAGIQLFIASIGQLLRVYQGVSLPMPQRSALLAVVVSIAGKLLLALNQYILGKKASSMMILANARNMLNDSIISVSVLFSCGAALWFHAPYIDPLVALLVGCWIIKSAITLFIELNVELMDGNTNKQLYEKLFSAVAAIPAVKNPHRARIRKMANLWDIDLDIEVDGAMPVSEAHLIAEKLSLAIRQTLGNVYDIVIHIEPYNSDRAGERYGVSLEEMDSARHTLPHRV